MRRKIKWFWELWSGNRHWIIYLVVLTILSGLVTSAYPMILKKLINTISQQLTDKSILSNIILLLIALAAGRFISSMYPAFRAMLNLRNAMNLRNRVFKKMIDKDNSIFFSFQTGDIITRITDDINDFISWFSCSGIFRFVDSSSRVLFCLVAMFIINKNLAIYAVIPLPIMLLLFFSVQSNLKRIVKVSRNQASQTSSILENSFSGIKLVKAMGAEQQQQKILSSILEKRVEVEIKLRIIINLLHSLDTLIAQTGKIFILAFGGIWVVQQKIDIGTLYAFYLYLDLITIPLFDIPNFFISGKQTTVSIDRIDELENYPLSLISYRGKRISKIDNIELRNIGKEIRGAEVFKDVDIFLSRSDFIAVKGIIGSGKTTLIKLIMGFIRPDYGEVLINNICFSRWDTEVYRNRIGYVPQEPILFSRSIRENLCFGEQYDRAEIWKVLEIVGLADEIKRLPDDIDSLLQVKGLSLSGGQRQRMTVARALIKNPDFLLMDDCTANLDAENEENLWDKIKVNYPQTGILITSHREATLNRANTLYEIKSGKLIKINH